MLIHAALIWTLALGCAPDPPLQVDLHLPLDVADLAAPGFTVFGVEEGLSDEIWSTVGFDVDGFVWAGSASGVARFDGYRWTSQPLADAQSLVRDMLVDGDGVLWAIFAREGLARYDGVRWEVVGPGRFFQRFSEIQRSDGTKECWAVHDEGLLRLVDGEWQSESITGAADSIRPIRIEETEQLFGGRRQWIAAARDGLWYRDVGDGGLGAWRQFEHPQLRELACTDLIRTHDRGAEELWVVSYGGGLARIDNVGVRLWRRSTGELPSEALYAAVATHSAAGERTLWVASRAGLVRIRDEELTIFDRRHGLPSDAVRGLKLQRIDGLDVL